MTNGSPLPEKNHAFRAQRDQLVEQRPVEGQRHDARIRVRLFGLVIALVRAKVPPCMHHVQKWLQMVEGLSSIVIG